MFFGGYPQSFMDEYRRLNVSTPISSKNMIDIRKLLAKYKLIGNGDKIIDLYKEYIINTPPHADRCHAQLTRRENENIINNAIMFYEYEIKNIAENIEQKVTQIEDLTIVLNAKIVQNEINFSSNPPGEIIELDHEENQIFELRSDISDLQDERYEKDYIQYEFTNTLQILKDEREETEHTLYELVIDDICEQVPKFGEGREICHRSMIGGEILDQYNKYINKSYNNISELDDRELDDHIKVIIDTLNKDSKLGILTGDADEYKLIGETDDPDMEAQILVENENMSHPNPIWHEYE